MVKGSAQPDRFDSMEAKARWFQALTVEERMEWLDREVEAALAADPGLVERSLPEEVPGKVRILRLPRCDDADRDG